MDADVIIVGAGPVGLALAGELRLGGADVIVFERRTSRSTESRGLGFTARAAEIFGQRGLLNRFENPQTSPQGHFGGIPFDFSILEGSHFGVRGIPQYKIEEMLEGWAAELGARLMRGHEVTGLRDGPDHVTAAVTGPSGSRGYSARYLVGCDGGRSTIRMLGGFDFPGTNATKEMFLADVSGCQIRPRFIGERVPGGMVMAAPLEDGIDRIIVCPDQAPPPREAAGPRQVSFEEVADAWQQLTGQSLHHGTSRWVSSFTDATRQVTQYRRGRVLLAGDAAHIHLPAGGQGLSVGVQDAANLGWKLAAVIAGWAPDGLLDSYHDERHPVGARLLRNTRAQGTLYLTGPAMEPMRKVMTELIAIPAVARHLSGMVSGFDIRYDMAATGHPLLGTRMPDRNLTLATGQASSVAELLHQARGILITADSSGHHAAAAASWRDRVDLVTVTAFPAGPEDNGQTPQSALIRPDGYIAWTAPGDQPLEPALQRWFGAASHQHPTRRKTVNTNQVHTVTHQITIDAPAARVYELIADVARWPEVFTPTVHVEYLDKDQDSERIRIWATANGTAKTWTSRRHLDPANKTIQFRQEQSQAPVGGMGGTWLIEPRTESTCQVQLLHDYYPATSDPADLDWISQAVDRNSTAELNALKTWAETSGDARLITFEDTVTVDGTAKDVYDFLDKAQLWQQRLPHVARVRLQEDTPGLQILEMDTTTKDGSVHTTRSVRVCQPHHAIIYKQTLLPALMTLHTGRWSIIPRQDGGVNVSSRHTVQINTTRITDILGPQADLHTAQDFITKALSGNSLATLHLAKTHAETASHAIPA